MADDALIERLKQGVGVWNYWRRRENNLDEVLDLQEADLRGLDLGGPIEGAILSKANLQGADLSGANLSRAFLMDADLQEANLSEAELYDAALFGAIFDGANLSGAKCDRARFSYANLSYANLSGAYLGADLYRAYLSEADLTKAYLGEAKLIGAILSGANLREANLSQANLSQAILSGANLFRADLSGTLLTKTNLTGANLTGCSIYGVSAWNLTLSEETEQQSLNIFPDLRNLLVVGPEEVPPTTTVDDLEAAQFVYLLRGSERSRQIEKIRQVMEAIGLGADDVLRSPTTAQGPTSDGERIGPESQETKVVDPAVGKQNGAPSVDETKRHMRSAMAELNPEVRHEVLNDLNRSFLPTQMIMDRVWQIIVWAFAVVFVISAIALCVGALWMPDRAEIQMLLTVVTTIAGVLAGFISGRASASQSPS